MPTMHIPEDAYTTMLMDEDGDRDTVRERVKRAVCEEAGVEYTPPEDDA